MQLKILFGNLLPLLRCIDYPMLFSTAMLRLYFASLLLVTVISTGCKEESIHLYSAPKDPPSTVQATSPTDVTREETQERSGMHWSVPPEWRREPGNRSMRVATFTIGNENQRIEVAVSAFPGTAGGILANVNRWRAQLGLNALTTKSLPKHLDVFSNGPIQGFILDMTGANDGDVNQPVQRIVGGIILGLESKVWFVKAKDEYTKLAPHKEAIYSFIRSFHTTQPSSEATQTLKEAEAAPHKRSPVKVRSATSNPDKQLPTHWQRDP